MTTATKLELRIDLGPGVLGELPSEAVNEKKKSPYLPKKTASRAKTTGAKPRDTSSLIMAGDEKADGEKKDDLAEKRKQRRLRRNAEVKVAKKILRNKDTPPSGSRVVINEEENKEQIIHEEKKRGISVLNRTTPAVTLHTPLRGNPDSPLKPYKFRPGRATRSSLLRLTTPGTAPYPSRTEERKKLDVEVEKRALNELFSALSVGTRMLEFKDLMKVKVTIGVEEHVSKETLENLNTFEKIIDELCVQWKINRMDLDLLEDLLQSIGLIERFATDLEKYKGTIKYYDLPATSEREVTTIIGSLHNLLQGSEEATGIYTTMSFLHYGNVYSFNRSKLSCMKNDLSTLLKIHTTQMTYIAKVPNNIKGYSTVFMLPCSVSKRLLLCAKKNHDVLMSLGLKGVQVTGSDGLRYTQSMSYLEEKVPVATQTGLEDLRLKSRNAQTAPLTYTLPPLSRLSQVKDNISPRPFTRGAVAVNKGPFKNPDTTNVQQFESRAVVENWFTVLPTSSPHKFDPSFIEQPHPNDEKFERRVELLRSTLSTLSQSDSEELIKVLLEQVQSLHRAIASLKKDLKEKSRDLNLNQGFVQKAEKEIKSMEMRLETKAQQISEVNSQLVKKIKRVMGENIKLKEVLRHLDAEIDIYRQFEKDNRFGNSIRAVRLSRPALQQGAL